MPFFFVNCNHSFRLCLTLQEYDNSYFLKQTNSLSVSPYWDSEPQYGRHLSSVGIKVQRRTLKWHIQSRLPTYAQSKLFHIYRNNKLMIGATLRTSLKTSYNSWIFTTGICTEFSLTLHNARLKSKLVTMRCI